MDRKYFKTVSFTFALMLMLIIGASVSSFADTAASSEYTATSIDDLKWALTQGYSTIYLGDAPVGTTQDIDWTVDSRITIPKGVTLDLNGKTVPSKVDYAFYLDGANASIRGGTIQGGGVRVKTAGNIKDLVINNAPDRGIWVYEGTAGTISNNKVSGSGRACIQIQSGKVTGNISGNNISGSRDTSWACLVINDKSKVSGKVSGNTISSGKGMGIYMHSRSSCGNIENNNISGCASHAIRLVGSSKAKTNDGCSAGDIAGNTITNCRGHGISLYNGSHCGKITHNRLKNLGGATKTGDFAIIVNAGSCFKTYASEITYNEVDGITEAGIVAFSGPEGQSTKKYQDFGYIQGDIAYNKVSNNATARKNVNWKNPKKAICEGAIYVDCHARVYGSIHHNTVNTSYDDGINVLAYSQVTSIHDNTVNNAHNSGISVKNYSQVKDIYNNTVNSPGIYGIFVNSHSKVTGSISRNTVSVPGETGLAVLQGSSVRTFTGNTIKNAGLYGVLAGGGASKIPTVSSNKISTSNKKEGYGIFVNSKCCISKILKNKVSGKYLAGIRVKQPSGKITVKSNTLKAGNPSSSKSMGMFIDGCKNKTITIRSNKITGNKSGPGIYIKTSKSVIKSNKIKKVTKKIAKG